MGFNMMNVIGKVVSLSKMIKNPKQAINQALKVLEKQNPKKAKLIRDAINSGVSPTQFAKEQAANGTLNEKNLRDLKQYYGVARKMGLPSIPDADWAEIESAIKSVGGKHGNSGFSGF